MAQIAQSTAVPTHPEARCSTLDSEIVDEPPRRVSAMPGAAIAIPSRSPSSRHPRRCRCGVGHAGYLAPRRAGSRRRRSRRRSSVCVPRFDIPSVPSSRRLGVSSLGARAGLAGDRAGRATHAKAQRSAFERRRGIELWDSYALHRTCRTRIA